MKRSVILLSAIVIILSQQCTQQESNWKIMDNPLLTEWAIKVDPVKPWPEYPRPDMVREEWINLNGLWDYAITDREVKPQKWDGKILVPFPLESALSGVKRNITDTENLWYRTTFSLPGKWKKRHILLNFEASDWETRIWIDGKEAGIHRGGYDPFSFEISGLLNEDRSHELLVCVWDPTNKGPQLRGKQVNKPAGIWYTPTTGIWQTVWLEPVEKSHVSAFRMVPDIDSGTLSFIVNSSDENAAVNISVSERGNTIAEGKGKPGSEIRLLLENPVLWSPENPFLYDVSIELEKDNRITDRINAYAGMRKISLGKTDDGFTRILLNNKFVFQIGPLDQGFWPDGLYTPPSDEAMIYDLKMTKKMGFNMLRKHVKVENRRFYNWCDKMGILVWQDMPSGDKHASESKPEITKSPDAKKQFEIELSNMVNTKFNHPSIIMWVLFNEGWGQFETEEISWFLRQYDPTRLINSASGWVDLGTGDVKDAHSYPDPKCPEAEENRAIVIGEYGGLGFPVKDHLWEPFNWGYKTFEDTMKLLTTYESYIDLIYRFVEKNGLSAVVYTQITDVETETNGLITYDRKIDKMGAVNISRANSGILPPVLEKTIPVFSDEFPVVLSSHNPEAVIYCTLDGSDPDENSGIYKAPFAIRESCELKTFAKYGTENSRIISYPLIKKEIVPAPYKGKYKKGLNVNIYEGKFTSLPDFSLLKPVRNLISQGINPYLAEMKEYFALTFDGYILIPQNGVYGFTINSYGGSELVLDDKIVLPNEGVHPKSDVVDYYALGKGFHKLHIGYYQTTGRDPVLRLRIEFPDKQINEVSSEWLYHQAL